MAAKKRKKRRPQRAPSKVRNVLKKPTSDQLVDADYEITAEPLDNPYPKYLPAQVRDTLADLCDKAQRSTNPERRLPTLNISSPPIRRFLCFQTISVLPTCRWETSRKLRHVSWQPIAAIPRTSLPGSTMPIPASRRVKSPKFLRFSTTS